MGFPAGYSELPTLLLNAIFLLGHVRRLVSWAFDYVGLGDLLDSDERWRPDPPADTHHQQQQQQQQQRNRDHYNPELPESLIDEILPVVRYEALGRCGGGLPESCAVCLHELEGREEVRRLSNCRHVFHRWCLDRWIGHGQRTCPLCRAPLFPDEPPTADWVYDEDDDYFPSPSSTPLLLTQQLPSL